MKKNLFLVLAVAIVLSACSQYSCPTYGSPQQAYSAPKKKSYKSRSSASTKKPVKRAEQE